MPLCQVTSKRQVFTPVGQEYALLQFFPSEVSQVMDSQDALGSRSSGDTLRMVPIQSR